MDAVLSLNEPLPLDRSVYVRPPAHYYITSEMKGQCNNDLYELARKTGAFSEAQIG